MVPPSRLSGLQKDVLALYRKILRQAVFKDRQLSSPTTTPQSLCQLLSINSNSTTAYARGQFRKEASLVRRSDFKRIEYKLRKGEKQLTVLSMPGVNLVGGV